MNIRDYKKILPHALLIAGALLVLSVLFALSKSEEAKTRDVVAMQNAIDIKLGLYRYYLRHAAYPSAKTAPLSLGSSDTDCLSDNGFISRQNTECAKRSYLLPVPAGVSYTPLAEQGDIFCDYSVRCPRYAILFFLETNMFGKKGTHSITQEGFQRVGD